MTIDAVRTAYGARAGEYAAALGSISHVAAADLALVGNWADGLSGPVVDAGSGPGHWNGWLAGRGLTVLGVDPVPEFVEIARASHPGVGFRVGQASSLPEADAALGGVFAWYSLIHASVNEVSRSLAEFARCVRPGGGLLLGFFAGALHSPFGHAVTTAYYWPVAELAAMVEAAGFTVTHSGTRTDPGSRTHGEIVAVRRCSGMEALAAVSASASARHVG